MSEICIYCMGDYGLETYFKLKEMGIKVKCFGDRDTLKHGYALEGIFCISYEEVLQLDKEETILVVAVKNPNLLIEKFRGQGFAHVYDKDEILSVMKPKKIQKKFSTLGDIELIEYYKSSLVQLYYEGTHNQLDNVDMQQIIEDLSKRRIKS